MKSLYPRLLLLVVGLGAAACHRQPATSSHPAGSPTPAEQSAVATPGAPGKAGLPDFAVEPVRTEEGLAEWYDVPDDSLAARRAWPDELTAASDTLPQGAYVRVTPLSPEKSSGSGKPVVVRITDDGVHKKGVLVDVDRDAARTLGIVKPGEAKVRVEVLSLKNATVDKPVDSKDAPVAPKKVSEITATPAASAQAELDAAKVKAGGATP